MPVKELNGDEEADYVGPPRVLMHLRSFIVRFIVNYTCASWPGVRYWRGVAPETPGGVSLRRVRRDQRTIGGTRCRGSRCNSAVGLFTGGRTDAALRQRLRVDLHARFQYKIN